MYLVEDLDVKTEAQLYSPVSRAHLSHLHPIRRLQLRQVSWELRVETGGERRGKGKCSTSQISLLSYAAQTKGPRVETPLLRMYPALQETPAYYVQT